MKCRNCRGTLFSPIISFGDRSLPRFPRKPSKTLHARLNLVRCISCQLVQLDHTVKRQWLFSNFWFQSHISTTIESDLIQIALEGANEIEDLNGVAVDIGANDGTLLKYLPKTMRRIGYEPAKNLKTDYERVYDYFRADLYGFPKAQLITAIGMFYDLQEPVKFCQDVAKCLDRKGVFIIQQNYLPAMIKNVTFDNICHEHLTYFSLETLSDVLRKAKLSIYKTTFNNVNGGSFRVFVCHQDMKPQMPIVEEPLDYHSFAKEAYDRIDRLDTRLAEFKNKRVMLYGAGTRGATIFGSLKPFPFEAAVDNNPAKHGRYYLDTKVPIISYKEAMKNPPDAFVLLPYFLKDEINLGGVETILP